MVNLSINRIRLEFKSLFIICCVVAEIVLIESDWNLNQIKLFTARSL